MDSLNLNKTKSNLTVCPDCSNYVSQYALSCPKCGRIADSKLHRTQNHSGGQVFAIITWLAAIGGAGLGVLIIFGGMAEAKSAPQESVVICLALAATIIPYCIARAITEIVKMNK